MHVTFNHRVGGSSPPEGATFWLHLLAISCQAKTQLQNNWACPGFEPETSRTQSEKPNSFFAKQFFIKNIDEIYIGPLGISRGHDGVEIAVT